MHDRMQERLRRGRATAPADRSLEIADAFVVAAVVIVVRRNAVVERCLLPRFDDFPADAVFLHAELTVGAVRVVGAARVFLDALEVRENVVPGPADVSELAPDVVVAGVAADVTHRVDRRRSAEHLAARHRRHAVVGERLWFAFVAPVHGLVAEQVRQVPQAHESRSGRRGRRPRAAEHATDGSAVSRLASTQPAEPAPTMM